jgi:hypothetical protein
MGESSDLTATMQNIGMALWELRPALVPTKLYTSTYLVLFIARRLRFCHEKTRKSGDIFTKYTRKVFCHLCLIYLFCFSLHFHASRIRLQKYKMSDIRKGVAWPTHSSPPKKYTKKETVTIIALQKNVTLHYSLCKGFNFKLA